MHVILIVKFELTKPTDALWATCHYSNHFMAIMVSEKLRKSNLCVCGQHFVRARGAAYLAFQESECCVCFQEQPIEGEMDLTVTTSNSTLPLPDLNPSAPAVPAGSTLIPMRSISSRSSFSSSRGTPAAPPTPPPGASSPAFAAAATAGAASDTPAAGVTSGVTNVPPGAVAAAVQRALSQGRDMQPLGRGVGGVAGHDRVREMDAGASSRSSNVGNSRGNGGGTGGRVAAGVGVGAGGMMKPPMDRRVGRGGPVGVATAAGTSDDTSPLTDSMIQEHNRQMGVKVAKKVGQGK
jgi:hypothetical protein